jgi:hypothetical protein
MKRFVFVILELLTFSMLSCAIVVNNDDDNSRKRDASSDTITITVTHSPASAIR